MSIWKPWAWKPASYEADQQINSTFLIDDPHYVTDDQLLESPWLAILDMSSPRQAEKAEQIRELENFPGQTFQVKRASLRALNGSASGREHLVLQLDHVTGTGELEQLFARTVWRRCV